MATARDQLSSAAPREGGERLADVLRAIVDTLEKEADDRVEKRTLVERRWLEDLRQYNSEYEPEILQDLTKHKKSKLFINQTRPKTNACEARLSDMLFPTDDDNWGIRSTPVPELADNARKAVEKARELVDAANAENDAGREAEAKELAAGAQTFADTARKLKEEMDEARQRAKAMADEIRDQLKESGYNIACRDVIRDACQIGTGIMLGPVGSTERSRRSWKRDQGATGYNLDMVDDSRPAYYRVDPWGWFPQSDALTVDESESFFERYLNTAKAMRDLARDPGFDKNAIRRVLSAGPSKTLPVYLSALRAIKGDNIQQDDNRYVVWCYRGPIAAEDMGVLCECLGDDQMAAAAGVDGEIDPLKEISVVLWFCQGEVLKFGIHHLDSGEGLYSVYNIEKDNAGIWGYGIPYIMRNSQKAMNGAWRMMMDNSGLSSRPLIEIDTAVIDPADDEWTLVAGKVFLRKKDAPPGRPGITTYNIESHQAELEAIIELAKQFIDDETSISVLAQGEQGTHTTQTKGGMAILMNAVNVVFRRMVKGFDDDMTVPNIRRIYDWNMQFSDKDHIKGDYDIDARGTAVLLVREVQSQNLMVALGFTDHPVLGPLLKAAPILRKTFQSMLIEADEVVKTDDEIREAAERAAATPPPPDPIQIRAQATVDAAQINSETKLRIAELENETARMTLAETRNMSGDDINALLSKAQIEADSRERMFAGKVAVEERRAAAGGDVGKGIG